MTPGQGGGILSKNNPRKKDTVTTTATRYYLDRLFLETLTKVSRDTHSDGYYKVPKIVECFIQRCNDELPKGWRAEPWTMNRAVSIFHWGEFKWSIAYEAIEDDIVKQLDDTQRFVAMVGNNG